MNTNNLVLKAIQTQLLNANQPLVESWRKVLDAPAAPEINDPWRRAVLARLLENTKLYYENRQLFEAPSVRTTADYGSSPLAVTLGMVRQIFPRMLALELVATQPLDRPTGRIFYLQLVDDSGAPIYGGFGILPHQSAASAGYSSYQASRAYANHTTEGEAVAKGVGLKISHKDVSADSAKKLLTTASWELVNDLPAYFNLDAMQVLQAAASQEIAFEKDATIVRAIRDAAIANYTVTCGGKPPTGQAAYWLGNSWVEYALPTAILMASAAIQKASLRSPSYMLIGMDALLGLTNIKSLGLELNPTASEGIWALMPIGRYQNVMRAYVCRTIPANEIILGVSTDGLLDAGITYAPYIPLFMSDRVFNPENGTYVQHFATRYALVTNSTTTFARVVFDRTAEGLTE